MRREQVDRSSLVAAMIGALIALLSYLTAYLTHLAAVQRATDQVAEAAGRILMSFPSGPVTDPAPEPTALTNSPNSDSP